MTEPTERKNRSVTVVPTRVLVSLLVTHNKAECPLCRRPTQLSRAKYGMNLLCCCSHFVDAWESDGFLFAEFAIENEVTR